MVSYNPDPFDYEDGEVDDMQSMGTDRFQYPTEEGYFEEIIAKIQGCPDTADGNGVFHDQQYWEEFNFIMGKLVELGHTDYERMKITPEVGGGKYRFLHYSTYKMKLLAAARKMAHEFGFGDVNYILHHDGPNGGTKIANSLQANPTMNSTQTNTQITKIGINIQELEEALGETLSDEQLAEIKPKIDKFASEPKKWINAESLIKGALGFGKEAGLLVLRAVLDKYMT